MLGAVVAFGTIVCVHASAIAGMLEAVVTDGIVVSVRLELVVIVGVLLAVVHAGTIVSVTAELAEIVAGVEEAVVHPGTVI